MGRPRAVSSADMARTLESLAKAGILVGEVIVEPGRVRILPKGVAAADDRAQGPKPKEWPSD